MLCSCLSLSLTSLLSRPVFIQESVLSRAWLIHHALLFCTPDSVGPSGDERILAPARQIYDEWQAASPDTCRIALDAALASGLTRLPGKDSARAQCRDLTLFGSPLPGPHATLRPLTLEQVEALGIVPLDGSYSTAPPAIVLEAADLRAPAPALEEPPSSHDGGGSPTRRFYGGRKRASSRSRSTSRMRVRPLADGN